MFFVSFPGGAGKSLCFAVLPYLLNLLKFRVSSVRELAACTIGDCNHITPTSLLH